MYYTTCNVLAAAVAVCAIAAAAQPAAAQVSAEEDLATIRNYVKVSDRLATSGQIAYDQIAALHEAGYEVVINLAPPSLGSNELEGYLVTDAGLSYVQIPVDWQKPSLRDLELFYAVMEANRDRKVFVHCFANMRASAFTYLYRTLVAGESDAEALADMTAVWDPSEVEQWSALIETAKAEHAR